MKHKWILAGMSLTLCASVGIVALLGLAPSGILGMALPSSMSHDHIRIELPQARIAAADLSADLEAAAILREAVESAEPLASETEPKLAIATDSSGRDQTKEAHLSRTSRPDGLLDVTFDLSRPDILDRSSLDVRKVVRFNGADAGQATIRVGHGSALFIAREDLRSLLSGAGRVDLADKLATGAERPFVAFDEVRQAGLNLRYDAASDRILFTG
jgi:hypothetical protein